MTNPDPMTNGMINPNGMTNQKSNGKTSLRWVTDPTQNGRMQEAFLPPILPRLLEPNLKI
jgi:hypothetical protein